MCCSLLLLYLFLLFSSRKLSFPHFFMHLRFGNDYLSNKQLEINKCLVFWTLAVFENHIYAAQPSLQRPPFLSSTWPANECCGSVKVCNGSGCGSGSADPYLGIMDSDPDPAIFVTDLQYVNKKSFFAYYLLFEGTFTSYFKDKKS